MTKPVVVNIPHNLGRAEAHRRLETGFVRIREQISGKAMAVEEAWQGDRLQFRMSGLGQSVSGRLDVLDDSVRIEVDLPWLLASVADKLRSRIAREGTLLLEKK
ncbi:polyhydroxyalkanoic acid system family protein [Propylenella binzhouense]|uniref:Polyhydroxyalkanoic acid synthase n=1 Tax=Propylenella binzhouense TaxID=2555902 RepID=A0A964WUA2_9HYPH|nr:polyhydroxyalkanoic acid system family protein [Propylenella binzhouense]MYZ48892.1 polyhydroxyalkanoic acid synthase [Propylenella binzhouense]